MLQNTKDDMKIKKKSLQKNQQLIEKTVLNISCLIIRYWNLKTVPFRMTRSSEHFHSRKNQVNSQLGEYKRVNATVHIRRGSLHSPEMDLNSLGHFCSLAGSK